MLEFSQDHRESGNHLPINQNNSVINRFNSQANMKIEEQEIFKPKRAKTAENSLT